MHAEHAAPAAPLAANLCRAAVQLKLSAASASVREKLPTYTPVASAELNGHAMNGRHFGEGSIARTSPRSATLK